MPVALTVEEYTEELRSVDQLSLCGLRASVLKTIVLVPR